MAILKSNRARTFLENARHFRTDMEQSMTKYPGEYPVIWVEIEWDMNNVKNLSFFGEIQDHEKVIIESMANLLIGKPISTIKDLSIRECEAFLRDRNSEISIEGMTENDEKILKRFFQWIGTQAPASPSQEYTFHSEKGPFSRLKLVDKIRELKAFLNSPEILTLYQNFPRPLLVDVEDLTVYIHAPYDTQREKSLFEEMHILGVEAFREDQLNFIPEA